MNWKFPGKAWQVGVKPDPPYRGHASSSGPQASTDNTHKRPHKSR